MLFITYLLKKFTTVFVGAIIFFVIVLQLLDIFTNLWQYMAENVPITQILKVFLLYTPKAVSYSVPLSILFATSFVISDLYAKNELTAIFASGVSLFRFMLPLLILALLVSAAMFFFEDTVVVSTYKAKTELQDTLLKQQYSVNNNQIIVLADSGNIIYKADFYDDEQKRLYNVFVFFRNEAGMMDSILSAASASFRNDVWEFSGSNYYVYTAGAVQKMPVPDSLIINEPPETFQNIVVSVEEIPIAEAKQYITYLRRVGLPYAESLALYYKKFSFPLTIFIVVFLSIGLSGKTRKNVLLVSLALSVSSAVIYYITQMVTMLLAQFGYISPLVGAWFPVILFFILSIVLLVYAKT